MLLPSSLTRAPRTGGCTDCRCRSRYCHNVAAAIRPLLPFYRMLQLTHWLHIAHAVYINVLFLFHTVPYCTSAPATNCAPATKLTGKLTVLLCTSLHFTVPLTCTDPRGPPDLSFPVLSPACSSRAAPGLTSCPHSWPPTTTE